MRALFSAGDPGLYQQQATRSAGACRGGSIGRKARPLHMIFTQRSRQTRHRAHDPRAAADTQTAGQRVIIGNVSNFTDVCKSANIGNYCTGKQGQKRKRLRIFCNVSKYETGAAIRQRWRVYKAIRRQLQGYLLKALTEQRPPPGLRKNAPGDTGGRGHRLLYTRQKMAIWGHGNEIASTAFVCLLHTSRACCTSLASRGKRHPHAGGRIFRP